jgi:hypothetical protein
MRSIKLYLFLLCLSAAVITGCSFFGPDVIDIDVINNSSYNLTNVLLSTGYTEVGGEPEYTNSLSLGTLSAGVSSLDNTVPIDAGEGSFEVIQIMFEIDGVPYTVSDTFLYTYTHVNGSYNPGTHDYAVITIADSPYTYEGADPYTLSIEFEGD